MKLFPRLTAFTVATLIAISPLTTLAGEGHDHGEAPTASTGPALPRFAATSSTFELIGVLNGHDMTDECVVTKLMFLLGHNYSQERIQELMNTSLVGEVTLPED